jgi:hypothetical protein
VFPFGSISPEKPNLYFPKCLVQAGVQSVTPENVQLHSVLTNRLRGLRSRFALTLNTIHDCRMHLIDSYAVKSIVPSSSPLEFTSPLSPALILSCFETSRNGLYAPYRSAAPLDKVGVRTRVHGNRFYLVGGTIWGRRTSYRPAWRGSIEPGPDGSGSRVRVEAGPSLGTIIRWCVFCAWLGIVLVWGISHGISFVPAVLFLGVGLLASLFAHAASIDAANTERDVLLGILHQIAEEPCLKHPDSRSSSA